MIERLRTGVGTRIIRRRDSCRRTGHQWSDRCDPVACSRCGTSTH